MRNITIIAPYDKSIPLQVTAYRALMPRYGMMIVAAALKEAGYNVRVYCELSGGRVDWKTVFESDVVCFSFLSFSALKAYEYAERVRRNCDATIIFGGSHASVLPEDALMYCDYAVRNEGEETIVELLDALKKGGSVEKVRGISYRNGAGGFTHNPSRDFIEKPGMIADPALISGYGPKGILYYMKDALMSGVPRFNMAVAQGSRGCPNNCRFCFVKLELGSVYRTREPELVVSEVARAVSRLRTKYVFFADNDFTIDREHTLEILRLLKERFRGGLDLFVFARIFVARDGELLEALAAAGRVCVAVGVESVEPDTLVEYRKEQNLAQIEECMKLFAKHKDIKLHLLFMCGADTDTVQSIRNGLDLALRYQVFNIGLCSLYDFPTRENILGVPQSVPDHRFIHRDWRFFSGNFVVHYPKRIPPSELQIEMMEAYRKFYKRSRNAVYQYQPTQATISRYLPILKKAEEGLYDSEGNLREELMPGPLAETKKLDIRPNRPGLAAEIAKFYWGNLSRAQSWEYLFSLVRNRPAAD